MTDEKYPLNDLCEICNILDGVFVVDGTLVCFGCGRKLKKQNKSIRRKDERKRKTRQEAT